MMVEPELAIMYTDSVLLTDTEPSYQAHALITKGRCLQMLDKNVQALEVFNLVLESPLPTDHNLRGEAYFWIAEIYVSQKSPERAISNFDKAMAIFQVNGDGAMLGKIYLKLGKLRYDQFEFDTALILFQDALNLNSDALSLERAELQFFIGQIHFKNADLDEAQFMLQNAFEAFGLLNMVMSQTECAEQLVALYKTKLEFKKAHRFAHLAYQGAVESGNFSKAIDLLLECSWLSMENRENHQAIGYCIEAKTLAETHLPNKIPEILVNLAQNYHRTNMSSEAIMAYEDASRLAALSSDNSLKRKVALALMQHFGNIGEYEKAFDYSRQSDSLNLLIAQNDLMHIKQELAQSRMDEFAVIEEQKTKISQLKDEQTNLQRYLIYSGVGLLLIFALILYREFVRKRKLSKVLEWRVYNRTRELRKANKELNTYIYKSSHDLRTPLTSIKSLLRLLKTEEHNASTSKYHGLIDGCAEQMDDILINLSRAVDYKKVEISVVKIDFNKLQADLLGKEISNPDKINIEWKISEKVPFYSDAKLLKVILSKTIGNALNYRKGMSDDYCKITITTDSQGAILAIEDNGVGISEKVRTTVFDMFVKGSNKSKGAGLGLYLVKIAMDKLKGKVTVESKVDVGSKLIFQLPNIT